MNGLHSYFHSFRFHTEYRARYTSHLTLRCGKPSVAEKYTSILSKQLLRHKRTYQMYIARIIFILVFNFF